MLGSHNHFFTQSKTVLELRRRDVIELLSIKGYRYNEINIYLKAFDYFVSNTVSFDGATIVKDLCDLKGLDLDAMLHDYHYLRYHVASNFKTKFFADWIYAKGQERKGKGSYSSFSRFIGLTFIGLWFVPYANCKYGNIRTANRNYIINDYKTLIR